MSIHVRENLYPGVNAHLQSELQSPGGRWAGFHDAYVVDLTRALSDLLPPGYYALNEQSLQLVALDTSRVTRTIADIAIFETPERSASAGSSAAAVDTPATTIPLIETLTDEDYFQAVVIYQERGESDMVPVTRIELLSPANKPPGSHHRQYIVKRDETLRGAIHLIEIDFLHEQRPVALSLPSYPDKEPGTQPYIILVNRPYPTYDRGETDLYPFGVDDRIPTIRVPLAGGDSVIARFGEIYNQTYYANPFYGKVMVDYAHDPARMESYAPADQERIRKRMRVIAEGQGRSQPGVEPT